MVPRAVEIVDLLPLTVNGKVDRSALASLLTQPRESRPAVRPMSDAETLVATIWRDLLGVTSVAADDNFFDLGGTSLIGLQVVSRLRKLFPIPLAQSALFARPTVAGVVELLRDAEDQPGKVEAVARAYHKLRSMPAVELAALSLRARPADPASGP
jgi:mycobactin phenyloxazoline synthetase